MLASCQADLNIGVDLRDSGGGTVAFSMSLNEATLSRYPLLFEDIDITDIEAGGWITNGASERNRISAQKSFTRESQIQELLDEISPGSFKIKKAERSRASGKNRITLGGEFHPDIFRHNLDFNSSINLESLPQDAARIRIALTLGSGDSFSERSWTLSLTSDEVLEFEHTHDLGEDANRLWRWVTIAAFALLGLAILLNITGWLYLRRRK